MEKSPHSLFEYRLCRIGIIYWCFWTVVLEKILESPLDRKKIQPVHSEGDQPWDFFGRHDAKAETPLLWPSQAKGWLIGKNFDAGRDWGQEEKGTTGWDGWMASLTWWTWVWVNSGSWWWTGRPGVLRFMGQQRVIYDWETELNWFIKCLIEFLRMSLHVEFLIWYDEDCKFNSIYLNFFNRCKTIHCILFFFEKIFNSVFP